MKNDIKKYVRVPLLCLLFTLGVCLVACGKQDELPATDKTITVTLINGEHYSVIGENRQTFRNEPIVFRVALDRGYKIVGAYGDACEISQAVSFEQTVTFTDVPYKSTVRLETAAMEQAVFVAVAKDDAQGNATVTSTLGQASADTYYVDDRISVSAVAAEGYRFHCWSTGNFYADGGTFYSYGGTIVDLDIRQNEKLYANFKTVDNTGNMLIYDLDGTEIEQDCTALVAHHPRANTYTAVDLRKRGVDCDGRLLAGWQTEEGDYIGLGSRVAVSNQRATYLTPIWKQYTDASQFRVTAGGGIVSFSGDVSANGEVVVPDKINGITVTSVEEGAFAESSVATVYLPDTIDTVKDNAFQNCKALAELYMSDSIMHIDDAAFTGCENFATVHINAYLKPRYSQEEVSAKTDVYDRLAANADSGVRKFVVLGGSSVKYGYSQLVMEEIFDQAYGAGSFDVYNLGFNATYSEAAQFEIANAYLKQNDVFLHAPEQYATAWCGNIAPSPLTSTQAIVLTDGFYIFRLTENNWQFLSSLTIHRYTNFFSLFSVFNRGRSGAPEKEYSDFYPCADVDAYGTRQTGETVLPAWGKDQYFYGGTINFDLDAYIALAKTLIYTPLTEKGVCTFVGFPPINRQKLLLSCEDEAALKTTVDAYTQNVRARLDGAGLQVVLTQYDSVYDGRHFSDNDYHLGDPFRDTHTRNIVSAVVACLQAEARV